jgi:DNA repair exonuclease SbcCD ATPase subunit
MTFDDIVKRALMFQCPEFQNAHVIENLQQCVRDLATLLAERERSSASEVGINQALERMIAEDNRTFAQAVDWKARAEAAEQALTEMHRTTRELKDGTHGYTSVPGSAWDIVCQDRDEWKRRCEKVVAERDDLQQLIDDDMLSAKFRDESNKQRTRAEAAERSAGEMAQKLAGEMQALVARAEAAERERDAAHKRLGELMRDVEEACTGKRSDANVWDETVEEVLALRAERDEAVAVLRSVEFPGGHPTAWCPSCSGFKDLGHKSDCAIARVIGKGAAT